MSLALYDDSFFSALATRLPSPPPRPPARLRAAARWWGVRTPSILPDPSVAAGLFASAGRPIPGWLATLSAMLRHLRLVLGSTALAAGLLSPALAGPVGAKVVETTRTYAPQTTFSPKSEAKAGSTDVYHCSLIDPHIATDAFVTGSQFLPAHPKELHHAIFFLIPPDKAAVARSLNRGGKGWSCFGAPLNPSGSFDGTAWLGGWAPGSKGTHFGAGTGIAVKRGSLIVEQIHYNLLNGSVPDRSGLRVTTQPQRGSTLKALTMIRMVAPPDLPCPTGVSGPLCDREASLADLSARFGPSAVSFVNGIEWVCRNQHSPTAPVADQHAVSTSCDWPVQADSETIRWVSPHMHLLGQSEVVTLTRSDGTTVPLIDQPRYNFDAQNAIAVTPNVVAHRGDVIHVSCTYDPTLRQRNPQLRKLPPRFVTWGDGSSDEMCLATMGTTAS